MNPNNAPTFITPPPSFSTPIEPPKPKSKLPIIIIVVVIILIAAITVVVAVLISQPTKNKPTNVPEQPPKTSETSLKLTKIHERVNLSDSHEPFLGYVYDINGGRYTIEQMMQKLNKEDGNFFFPANPTQNKTLISENEWTSGASVYHEMLQLFGNPSTIVESYRELNETEGNGYYGAVTFIWHRGNFYISMVIEDFTNEPDRNFSYPNSGITVTMMKITQDPAIWNSLLNDESYEIYGRENL